MNMMSPIAAKDNQAEPPAPTPRPEVRAKVQELLQRSPAYLQLPAAQQQQIARDTALVADAMVGKEEPGMASVSSKAMAGETGGINDYKQHQKAVDAIGQQPFTAGAAREGAEVAGQFLNQINFVDFVSGLIDGVFNSIVTSSIEQMEAYSKMVADVSKSLSQFRDENTTEDDGKDALVEQFPDVFDIGLDSFSGSPTPKLMLRDGVDQDTALTKISGQLGSYADGNIDSIDVSDPEAEAKLIKAARSHVATARQQLLATMVMMGLNRVVVTNGKISAKILYDFSASSQRNLSRSAMAMDNARDAQGNMVRLIDKEGEEETSNKSKGDYNNTHEGGKSTYTGNYDSDYYTKGKYKYAQKPVMTAMSTAADAQSDTLTAKASLAGQVEVNFKSDYLPLDKMATPEMMAAIQMRSKPIDHNKPSYVPTAAQAPAAAPAQTAPARA
jgi:hypothetical protein